MIYFGDGRGGFEKKLELGARSASFAVASADLDGDGRRDLIFANAMSENAIYLQQRKGAYRRVRFGAARAASYGVCVGDWDGDGKLEIAIANSGSRNTVFRAK